MGRLKTLKSSMRSAVSGLGRFMAQTRGNVAMIFALVMPVLILVTVGGVDIHRAATVRANLQDALDAAALAAARSRFVTDEDLTRVGLASLKANLKAYPQIALREEDVTFTLTPDAVIIADATVDVDAIVANIILPPYGQFLDDTLPVSSHSEVNRSSKNIEVAMVLDITGSMAPQNRMVDLKAAAKDLIDIVVQDVQTPYYTRMAIVPYSTGVNVGSYANGARGTPSLPTDISGIVWTTGKSANISHITRSNPGEVTADDHGFKTGEYVWVSGVEGMHQINGQALRVVKVDDDRLRLQRWNGSSWVNRSTSGYNEYDEDGRLRGCHLSDCTIRVTSTNHGLENGEGVQITGVNGMTQVNNAVDRGYWVSHRTDHTFSISVRGPDWDTYTSGGTATCGRDGCPVRVFRNASNTTARALPISTCVSERKGPEDDSDASPTLAKVGRNYPTRETSGGNLINPCPSVEIQPLTDDRETLSDLIDDLPTVGSTAGQIGIAWGWYAISPNFNSLWSDSAAGPYDPDETVKAVIIMTDGEFNTPYCDGVIAQNAGTGSGGNDYKINCDGANPFTQSEAMCDGMKAQGVVVYTVGFRIAEGGDAAELLGYCATSSEHRFLPDTGGDLSEAFAAIGRDITRLRISR